MCQFHMKRIVRRYLTMNPKMLAARELKKLVDGLHKAEETVFKKDFVFTLFDFRISYLDMTAPNCQS